MSFSYSSSQGFIFSFSGVRSALNPKACGLGFRLQGSEFRVPKLPQQKVRLRPRRRVWVSSCRALGFQGLGLLRGLLRGSYRFRCSRASGLDET